MFRLHELLPQSGLSESPTPSACLGLPLSRPRLLQRVFEISYFVFFVVVVMFEDTPLHSWEREVFFSFFLSSFLRFLAPSRHEAQCLQAV